MMISQEVSPSSLLSPPTFPESQLTHETILKCDYRSLAILEKLLHVIASDSAYVAKCNNFVISTASFSFYVSKRGARERYIVDCPMSGTHSSFTLIFFTSTIRLNFSLLLSRISSHFPVNKSKIFALIEMGSGTLSI